MKFKRLILCLSALLIVVMCASCALQTKLPQAYYDDLAKGVTQAKPTMPAFTKPGETEPAQTQAVPDEHQPVTIPIIPAQPEDPAATQVPAEQPTQASVDPAAQPQELPPVETQPVETQPPETQAAVPDVSSWSKEEIISHYVDAVNKTKARTDPFTAHHSESFVADITEITGGDVVKGIANNLIGSVVKPSDEDLNFSGGTAVTGEGETIQPLLPKSSPCTLSPNGVASATATPNGSGYTVNITLVPETVDMNTAPVHNASCIGFLDISSIDISFMTVTSCDVNYSGSTITATINADGYVSEATYVLNMTLNGSAKAGFINGTATFTGYETEVWKFPW